MSGFSLRFTNTRSAVDLVKKSLNRVSTIVFFVTQILFIAYSGYLIFKNLNNTLLLILYSVLSACTITIFIVSLVFRKNGKHSRKKISENKNRLRLSRHIVKTIIYVLKFTIIGFSLYDYFTTDKTILVSVITMSAVLGLQIFIDIVLSLFNKYIDLLVIGFTMDTRYMNFHFLSNGADALAEKVSGDSFYTESEKKYVELIEDNGKNMKKYTKEKRKQDFKDNIEKIFNKNGSKNGKLNAVDKKLINAKYKKNQTKAVKLLDEKDKVDELLEKCQTLFNKLPDGLEEFKCIPTLVQMVKYYITGKYKEVPKNSIIVIVAAIIYFVSPFDIIPDTIPGIGLIDDAYVIKLCMGSVSKDVEIFQKWRAK